MKVSQLISELSRQMEQSGNLDVEVESGDCYGALLVAPTGVTSVNNGPILIRTSDEDF